MVLNEGYCKNKAFLLANFVLKLIECSRSFKNVFYRVFKKEGGKVKGYYTIKKLILGAV